MEGIYPFTSDKNPMCHLFSHRIRCMRRAVVLETFCAACVAYGTHKGFCSASCTEHGARRTSQVLGGRRRPGPGAGPLGARPADGLAGVQRHGPRRQRGLGELATAVGWCPTGTRSSAGAPRRRSARAGGGRPRAPWPGRGGRSWWCRGSCGTSSPPGWRRIRTVLIFHAIPKLDVRTTLQI